MKVIRPGEHTTNPTIFLAGPIQNAPNWHEDAINYLEQYMKEYDIEDVDIACPKLWKKQDDFNHSEQIDWESHYLDHSASYGAILFWLSNPDPNIQLDPSRSYAQTTRFELGEWFGKCQFIDTCIVVGIDSEFHGARYITKRCIDNDIQVFNSLENTCEYTVAML